MPHTGPFEDRRPVFSVTVTGHAAALPYSWRCHRPRPEWIISEAGAWFLVNYLDGVLRHCKDTHRLLVYTRAEASGVGLAVRAYCAMRGITCLLEGLGTTDFGPEARWRRDAAMVVRSNAVVWVGDREPDRDPVTLAAVLGIPYRVVPAPVLEKQEV